MKNIMIMGLLLLLSSCTLSSGNEPIETSSDIEEPESIVFLESKQEIRETVIPISHDNCDGANQTLNYSRTISTSSMTGFEVQTSAGSLIKGNPIPGFLQTEIQANFQITLSEQIGGSDLSSYNLPFTAERCTFLKHKLTFQDTYLVGYYDIVFSDGIARVKIEKLIEFELVGRESESVICENCQNHGTDVDSQASAVTETPFVSNQTSIQGEVNEIDGAELVFIPSGSFTMGLSGTLSDVVERPEHDVYLDDYWVYKYEVTNKQYRQCILSGNCDGNIDNYPADTYPAGMVNWYQSKNYCEWAGGRLPTEAEWEKAARGIDGRVFPWGYTEPNCDIANLDGCVGRTVPVGSYPNNVSPYGVYDMAGNVWEWVSDWYDETYYSWSPYENPLGPENGNTKIRRGGSWFDNYRNLYVTYRLQLEPSLYGTNQGFRCVLSE